MIQRLDQHMASLYKAFLVKGGGGGGEGGVYVYRFVQIP